MELGLHKQTAEDAKNIASVVSKAAHSTFNR